ncbi:hypothetical protein MBLNU459_g5721t1 [Dothideomycetes sp. NU459]
MSSAALQTVPQYSPSYHHISQQSPNTSPTSSRKHAPRSSGAGNGNGSAYNSPQQPQYQSSSASPAMTTPSARQVSSSSHVSPTSTRNYESYYADTRADPDMPASPYTSAYQQAQHERASSSRGPQQYASPGYGSGSEREGMRDSPSQSNRRDYPPPSGSGTEPRPRQSPAQSRSANAVGQPPVDTSLPREDSTIINRLVIDNPQEDIARERARVAEAQPVPPGANMPAIAALNLNDSGDDSGRAGPRSRQEHLRTAQPRKETKFGEYILGQTVGEGEFGKVKMGWKKEGGVQVAIKLIRRESLGNNPNRLPKIYREIAILRELQHPNIVRLHEMVETERHIGIIMEYASGGELFDYILNHRYLKDNAARRLFAQLVSGVGYLHKKGIVHRDLKLENLLLDRNRNIIITDFGFANTFNPNDELGEDIEYNITNKEFVYKSGLEQIQSDGHRRGDLMQTSCGSPCYAAPELVVSDSLYTGRKVDVWSCGVILYAMLAGYLPFDDDPANPEGDNINLLYKYIVSTPLTFPEYVTPHARDLLRRILVPDPRKRADLFEVARHSWLSEYAHVVGFITSSTTTTADIVNSAVPSDDAFEGVQPQLGRSASVREPSKPHQPPSPGLLSKHAPIDSSEASKSKQQRDNKRRTVQLEYVAPQTQTARGEPVQPTTASGSQTVVPAPAPANTTASQSKTRARGDSTGGPIEVTSPYQPSTASSRPPQRPVTQSNMSPPSRPGREPARSVSDSTAFTLAPTAPASSSGGRPSTGGTAERENRTARLPSRGNSYGLPVVATAAQVNAEGRFSQPKPGSGYNLPGAIGPDGARRDSYTSRPLSQQFPQDFQARPERGSRGHKRSSTVESITNKFFGRSNSRRQSTARDESGRYEKPEKPSRAYPPVSMKGPIANDVEPMPRPSSDSRQPSFSFNRKNSDIGNKRSSRRFSFLPTSFSRMSFSGKTPDQPHDSGIDSRRGSLAPQGRPESKSQGMAFGQGRSRSPSQSTTDSSAIPGFNDGNVDSRRRMHQSAQHQQPVRGATAPDLSNFQDPGVSQSQYSRRAPQGNLQQQPQQQYNTGYTPPGTAGQQKTETFYTPSQSRESQTSDNAPQQRQHQAPLYPAGFNDSDNTNSRRPPQQQRQQANVLQKNNRKFADAYEGQGNSGSSGGARRVMDWFRKRGKERSG